MAQKAVSGEIHQFPNIVIILVKSFNLSSHLAVFFYPLLHIHVCVLSCFLQVGRLLRLSVSEQKRAGSTCVCGPPSLPSAPHQPYSPPTRAPHPTSQQPGAPSPSLSHLAPSFPPLSSSQWLHCSVPARAWPTLPVSLCHHVFD